jgi:HEAT repeat protein
MLDETAQLLEDLKNPEPRVRARAARVIGNTGGAAVIEQLIQALGDADPKVFVAVKEALMMLRPQSNEAVIRALDSADNLICSGAVELAGEMNLRNTRDKIAALLRSPDREIKIAAAGTLVKFEGERARDALAPLLEDPDPRVRLHAVKTIGNLHESGDQPDKGVAGQPPAVPGQRQPAAGNSPSVAGSTGLLVPRLQDQDPDVRRATIEVLGRIGDQNCVESLRALEADEDPQIADAARQALVGIGERAVGPYIQNLSHKDVGTRLAALDALIKQGKAAVLPLIAFMGHRNASVRVLVTDILGDIGDPRALPGLVTALADRDRRVRLAAIAAIGKLGTEATEMLLMDALESGDSEIGDIAARALVSAGAAVSQRIMELLRRAPNPDLRARAARILGQIKEPLALGPLIDALKDSDEWVRAAAAHALGGLLDPTATGPLIACLNDAHPPVRAAAADALGQLRDLSATEALQPLLQDSQASVRAAATRAMGRIGDNIIVEPIIGLLDDSDRDVRVAAVDALGSLRVVKVLERLQLLARPWPGSMAHPEIKRAARRAVIQILKARDEDVELMKAQVESSQSTKVTYQ